jgi:hypothetical protein
MTTLFKREEIVSNFWKEYKSYSSEDQIQYDSQVSTIIDKAKEGGFDELEPEILETFTLRKILTVSLILFLILN